MKRTIAIFLLAVLSLTLVACIDPNASDLPLEETADISGETITFTGRLIIENNSYLIVNEGGSPINVSVEGAIDEFFDGYTTGDKVEVISSLVAESYPGQAFIYKVKLVEKGSIYDIPSNVLSELENLGWID